MLCISAVTSNLTELLVIAVTFVSSVSYQATPGDYSLSPQVTVITTAGNGPIRTFLLFAWIYTMIVPDLMSLWLS